LHNIEEEAMTPFLCISQVLVVLVEKRGKERQVIHLTLWAIFSMLSLFNEREAIMDYPFGQI